MNVTFYPSMDMITVHNTYSVLLVGGLTLTYIHFILEFNFVYVGVDVPFLYLCFCMPQAHCLYSSCIEI